MLCRDAVRFGAAWLGRRKLTDRRQVSGSTVVSVFPDFSNIQKERRPRKGHFKGSCPGLIRTVMWALIMREERKLLKRAIRG